MAEGKSQRSAGRTKSFKCDLDDLMTAVYSQEKDQKSFWFWQIFYFSECVFMSLLCFFFKLTLASGF